MNVTPMTDYFKTTGLIYTHLTITHYVEGVQYYPIKGDFTESIEKAEYWANRAYRGLYSLPTNNCLHYARDLLRYGTAEDPMVELCIHTSATIVPRDFYEMLNESE